MNFIDDVLLKIHSMHADDIIQTMSKIYEEPLERTELNVYPQFIQDIIFIIDLDTELSMQGISGLLGNSTGCYIDKMITALENIRASNDAAILQQILNHYETDPDDDVIDELADQLYLYADFDIWNLLETYVKAQKQTFQSA